ncbi:major capsid protein [uncultured Phascolarctobacterium sp.]|uniref:major capsid protein n=1 Tax=uncultured Phascolarctobacterium sp. TaxID=512296 RepID=UPI0025DF7B44|nr:major capsid protein [uncultured Phascolarctobacterium sp.]
MPINLDDTRTLLQAIERTHLPTTALIDTFFPVAKTFLTTSVDMEYRKGGRKMAPFVVPGSKGINLGRTGSQLRSYKAPLMRPKRTIEASDIERRGFGEDIYSQRTPEQRAQELRAHDMAELIDSCIRRQEWMAAQLLINGSYECRGFADDGETVVVDNIEFPEFDGKTTLSGSDTWDNASAKIYDMIGDASQKIRRNAGMIPTVAICSQNVVKYMLNNEQLYKYLLIPSRENMALMSIKPKLERPELLRFGFVESLNLEIYAYDGVYESDDGSIAQFIPDDHMIIGVPGRGKRLFGAITQLEADTQYRTYEGQYIPKITGNVESDTTSLAVSSRCVVCPEFLDDWSTLKVK